MDPNNLPPGTPQVNIVIRTSWKQAALTDFSAFQEQQNSQGYSEMGN
jgi:hypothetical protein